MSTIYQSSYKQYYINNKAWNPYLIGKEKFNYYNKQYYRAGLLDNVNLTPDHLIVCYTPGKIYDCGVKKVIQEDGTVTSSTPYRGIREFMDKNNNALRLYAIFPSSMQFYHYYHTLQPKHCYEIIRGNMPQKVHFDLDIGQDKLPSNYSDLGVFAYFILYGLLLSITSVLHKHNITIDYEKDFLIYQSHNVEKYSFHVLLKYYCHSNHQEAAKFYDIVMQHCNYSLKNYVDKAVYSKMQAFRLLHSSKHNSTRVKHKVTTIELDKIYTFENSDSDIEEFQHSLVSYVAQCNYLPAFEEQKNCSKCNLLLQEKLANETNELLKWTLQQQGVLCVECSNKYEAKKQVNVQQQVTTTMALQILATLEKAMKQQGIFKIRSIVNNYVVLDKRKPYMCLICKRIHSGENPYLTIQQDKIYYHCRRADSNNKFLLCNEETNKNDINITPIVDNINVISTNNVNVISTNNDTVQISNNDTAQIHDISPLIKLYPSSQCMPLKHYQEMTVVKFTTPRKFDVDDY